MKVSLKYIKRSFSASTKNFVTCTFILKLKKFLLDQVKEYLIQWHCLLCFSTILMHCSEYCMENQLAFLNSNIDFLAFYIFRI